MTDKFMERLPSNPHPRQNPNITTVFKGQAKRSRTQLDRPSRRADLAEWKRQLLPLARWLTLHVDEFRRMGYRVKNYDEFSGKL